MQALFDGVYLLEGQVGGRPLQLVFLRGQEASLLLDTGCAGDPEGFIAPQIRAVGFDPALLTWVLNTHSDLDHVGGNAAMRRLAPGARFACGDADLAACEDPAALFALRYDAYRETHDIFYGPDSSAWIGQQSGEATPIDLTFTGGEHIRLGPDWSVQVLSLPGHSRGHVGVLDMKHRALYGGDAIHGRVYLGLDGEPKLPPTYLHVNDYLSTIAHVEALPVATYVGCHWPVLRGAAIQAFCAESRTFVFQAEALILEALEERPMTLRELIRTLAPALGDWEHTEALDLELVFAFDGHVQRLLGQGRIAESGSGAQRRFRRLID